MEEDGTGRRPKRRCTKGTQSSHIPSAVHYVGYVEDDETPEMIMKKFEELEKVKMMVGPATDTAGEGPVGDGISSVVPDDPEDAGDAVPQDEAVLSEAQLLQVFKQTSIFNVRSALQGNDVLMAHHDTHVFTAAGSDGESSGEDDLWGEMRGFWSDEEDADFREHWKLVKRNRKGGTSRGPAAPRSRQASTRVHHDVITQYNTLTQALIRRRVRHQGVDSLVQIKVPNPLPLSWGRTVSPYVPPDKRQQDSTLGDENVSHNGCRPMAPNYIETDSIATFNYKALKKSTFLGVLINKGWGLEGGRSGPITRRLAQLPLPDICPVGFVFIWAEKQDMGAVVDVLYDWGYTYVENLTWVYLGANNTILTLEAPYAQRSHLTLFIFRRDGEGRDIELRHQRNPDVIFDCVRGAEGQAQANPEEVFSTIETLLPTGLGSLLELYAPRGARREGWTHIAEVPGEVDCQ